MHKYAQYANYVRYMHNNAVHFQKFDLKHHVAINLANYIYKNMCLQMKVRSFTRNYLKYF